MVASPGFSSNAWQGLDRPEPTTSRRSPAGRSHSACRSWLVDEFQGTEALLLADLGVTKSALSAIEFCDANPYSSQIQDPQVPSRIPSSFRHVQQARDFCRDFFDWYNPTIAIRVSACTLPKLVHYRTAVATRRNRAPRYWRPHRHCFPERFPNAVETRSAISSRGGLDQPSRKGELLR